MEPSRELDILIQDKVFDSHVIRSFAELPEGYRMDPSEMFPAVLDGTAAFTVPWYSMSIGVAWRIVDKIKELRFSERLVFTREVQRLVSEEAGLRDGSFIEPTHVLFFLKPVHICLATLKAVGYDIG